jgi:hypothetical protein
MMNKSALRDIFSRPTEEPSRTLQAARQHLLVNLGFLEFMDNIPHPVAILTDDGRRLVLANRRMQQELGLKNDDGWLGAEFQLAPEEEAPDFRIRSRYVEIRGRGYRLLTVVPARVLVELE